jgi:hypothetical protein
MFPILMGAFSFIFRRLYLRGSSSTLLGGPQIHVDPLEKKSLWSHGLFINNHQKQKFNLEVCPYLLQITNLYFFLLVQLLQ